MTSQSFVLPFKSVLVALLASCMLGPIGLLYSSFWGGVFMLVLIVFSFATMQPILAMMSWVGCCLWGVWAAESYNRKLLKSMLPLSKE